MLYLMMESIKNKVMAQEDKDLLLRDLSARLLYGVIMTNIKLCEIHYPLTCEDLHDAMYEEDWDDVPYLRPMSSMTEEEREEVNNLIKDNRPIPYGKINNKGMDNLLSSVAVTSSILIDWLNAHRFDYHGLIEKGLAVAVDKNNNPYK